MLTTLCCKCDPASNSWGNFVGNCDCYLDMLEKLQKRVHRAVGLTIATWVCWRRYRNGYIRLLVLRLLLGYVGEATETCKTDDLTIAATPEPLAHCRHLTDLNLCCRYCFGKCSSEMAE